MRKSLVLSGLYIYPVKSLGGISLASAYVENRGLKYDRRWMLVNSDNDFMTQRHYPQMALLQTEVTETGIRITDKKNIADYIEIPFEPKEESEIDVPIWDDRVTAVMVDKNIDAWFSEKLDVKCSLVYMPNTTKRQVDSKYAEEGDIVSFADGYPFLIIGQASLDDLNSRLEVPVPMNRFRPNFVFTGGAPYEEDEWNYFTISGLRFKAVKPCARCVITTIDQTTSDKNVEPLKTLSTYRKIGDKVMFGQNVIGYDTGTINVGDEIVLI